MIRVRDGGGRLIEKGVILFGLSGTGKMTFTCHHHFLSGDKGVKIRQDDVILLEDDGYCIGTEGLEPAPSLPCGHLPKCDILENVWVDEDGRVDFLNYELTSKGEGVLYRSEMRHYIIMFMWSSYCPVESGAGCGLLYARLRPRPGIRPRPASRRGWWQTDPDYGYEVPGRMDRVDMARFDPARFYSEEYKDRVERLRSERKQSPRRFSGLDPEIVAAIP